MRPPDNGQGTQLSGSDEVTPRSLQQSVVQLRMFLSSGIKPACLKGTIANAVSCEQYQTIRLRMLT